jgi:glutaredoxin
MPIPIVFYTRRNCPLCAEAGAVLEAFAARFPLAIEYRDVDSVREWRQRHGMEVPLAFLGERMLFKFRIDEAALESALLAYAPPASDDGT